MKTFTKWLESVSVASGFNVVIPNTVFGSMPSDATGTQSFFTDKPHTSDQDLGLPSTTKTGRIYFIDDKKNPIGIHLTDGTKIYIPFSSFKLIKGEPGVGKTITVVMQRRPEDLTDEMSQIQSITVH